MQAHPNRHDQARPPVTKLPDGRIHTLIVGAGPSGLATAYKLSQAGIVPLIVERGSAAGGLMSSIVHGEFTVDIGRKELYTRIPEVDRFWHELLGADYRPYDHRVGSLYHGRIVELSGAPRGMTRGLPVPWLIRGALDLVRCWLGSRWSKPVNYEQYWHQRAGRYFSHMLAQGYWEKFRGQAWADMPTPNTDVDGSAVRSYSFDAIRQGLRLASQGGTQTQRDWRHPAKGSGQISDLMLRRLDKAGVPIAFGTEVTSIKVNHDRICEVTTESAAGTGNHHPCHVVTSMQIEELAGLLDDGSPGMSKEPLPPGSERNVVMVYLFTDEPCTFPHAWLEVNDAELRCGRITNYAAFNGDMVPDGKACLCVEFFCVGSDDPILALSDTEVKALALKECTESMLINPDRLTDSFVRTIRRIHAAASWRDWQKEHKLELLRKVSRIENLFHVNRPGMDWATFAGMMASESILEGCRTGFDQRADPTRRYEEHQVSGVA